MAKQVSCSFCGNLGHYQTFCPNKPRKPISKGTPIGDYNMNKKEYKPSEIVNKKLYVKATVPKRTSLPDLLRLTEIVFNKWIRHRDSEWGHFKCISCGEYMRIEDSDCGHFMPKTYSSLRFNELNTNAECQKCNREDPNHLIGYRANLINKIGLDAVERLELTPFGENYKWNREELLELINRYKL